MLISMLSVFSMILGDIQMYIMYFTNYVLIFLIVLHLWHDTGFPFILVMQNNIFNVHIYILFYNF